MPPRLMGPADLDRASKVAKFINKPDRSGTGPRTVQTALRSTARRLSGGENDEWTFPWDGLAEIEQFHRMQQSLLGGYDLRTMERLPPLARSTAARYLSTTICLVDFLVLHKIGRKDEWANTVLSFDRPKRRSSDRRTHLTPDDLQRMLTVATYQGSQSKSARDAALLATMASTGARRSEVSLLERRNLDVESKTLEIFQPKTGTYRDVGLPDAAMPYVSRWLENRGDHAGPLFNRVLKSGRVDRNHGISDSMLYRHFKSFGRKANLTWSPTPHDMRRYFVTQLISGGADTFTVCRLVGHSSPVTTQTYDTRPAESLRHHLESLALPTFDELSETAEDMGLSLAASVEEVTQG